jgi:hypothetical protein
MTDKRITDLAMDVLREGKEGREMELATDVILMHGENARLRHAMKRAGEQGRAEVDKALAEYGYDSLRFADTRHGWLFTNCVLDEALKGRA